LKAKSAGRVQTPALKLIIDRYNEIQEFDKLPLESKLFYYIEAKATINNKEVLLKHTRNSKEIKFNTKDEAEVIFNTIKDNNIALITSIESKDDKKAPPKPFTTSKLLKIASKKLKLSSNNKLI
jgi:DNA topoisomerase-1